LSHPFIVALFLTPPSLFSFVIKKRLRQKKGRPERGKRITGFVVRSAGETVSPKEDSLVTLAGLSSLVYLLIVKKFKYSSLKILLIF